MKTGDKVRLVGLPADLPEGDSDLPTKKTFERCLGHTFEIIGFNEKGWAEIEITPVTGSIGEALWVEPEFIQLISN